jgi:hypothetical protein
MKTSNISIKESSLMFPYSSYNKKIESVIRRNSVLDKLSRSPNMCVKSDEIQEIITMENFIKKKNYRKKKASVSNKILQKIFANQIIKKLHPVDSNEDNRPSNRKTSKTSHNLFHIKSNLLQRCI